MKHQVWIVTCVNLALILAVFITTLLNGYGDLRSREEEQVKSRDHVIILAYIEGGGSLLGEILQQSPRVFYMHEPLRALRLATTGGEPITYLDGTEWNPETFHEVAVDTIGHLTTCNFEKIGTVVWKDEFLLRSNKGKLFHLCFKTMKTSSNISHALETCVKFLKTLCMDSRGIMISKLTRVSLKNLEPLMKNHPCIKVIHLFQDVKSIIKSQMDVGIIHKYNLKMKSFQLCRQIYFDFFTASVLKHKFPGRIFQLNFDDLISDSVNISKEIYLFSGLNFTTSSSQNIRKVVSDSLHNNKDIEKYVKLTKTDGTLLDKDGLNFARSVDEVCRFWTEKIKFDIKLSN